MIRNLVSSLTTNLYLYNGEIFKNIPSSVLFIWSILSKVQNVNYHSRLDCTRYFIILGVLKIYFLSFQRSCQVNYKGFLLLNVDLKNSTCSWNAVLERICLQMLLLLEASVESNNIHVCVIHTFCVSSFACKYSLP